MEKEDLIIIANALQKAINSLTAQVKVFEITNERPDTTRLYKEDLIPELTKSFELIKTEYKSK